MQPSKSQVHTLIFCSLLYSLSSQVSRMASNMDVSALVAEVYKAASGRDSRLHKAANISSDVAKALIREIGNKAENENSTEVMLAKAAVVFDREFGAPKVTPVVKPQAVALVVKPQAVAPVVKPQAVTPVVTTHRDVATMVAEVYKAAGGRDSRLSKAANISSDVAKALIREIGNKAENENSTEAMLAKAAVVFDREFGAPMVTQVLKPQVTAIAEAVATAPVAVKVADELTCSAITQKCKGPRCSRATAKGCGSFCKQHYKMSLAVV